MFIQIPGFLTLYPASWHHRVAVTAYAASIVASSPALLMQVQQAVQQAQQAQQAARAAETQVANLRQQVGFKSQAGQTQQA